MKALLNYLAEPGPVKSPAIGLFGFVGSLSEQITDIARAAIVFISLGLLIVHAINFIRLRRICPLGKDCPKAATCDFKLCPWKQRSVI